MSAPSGKLPLWVDLGLIPLCNLATALAVAGLVVLAIGQSPLEAVTVLIRGAFGTGEGIGYTLYYATNFIFTGLSVAIAYHAGLFNIGCEGQAYLGGLGVALICLLCDSILPWPLTALLAILAASLFGAAAAAIPAWLQARRGSHIVITTIMFNFLISALMNYLLVHVIKNPAAQTPETRPFLPGGQLPKLDWLMHLFGLDPGAAPVNSSFVIALVALVVVWVLVWRTRFGFEMRAMGTNRAAAVYAGIPYARIVISAMLISGALSGLMSLNSVMGDQQRLLLDFPGGAGFIGIAVALMGRNHPVGILLASVLFGMLVQGGAELAFEIPNISSDMIVVIQGLVILFSGAMENIYRPALTRTFART